MAKPPAAAKPPRFFRSVTVWMPTWRGWLLLLCLTALLVWFPGRGLHGFLSQSAAAPKDILVVEGWLPDYALRQALQEFNQGGYRYLVASGGPMERGALVSGYDTYAAIAAATLRRMGAPADRVVEAPAPATYRNRTFQSAVSVQRLIADRHLKPRGIVVASEGPHARRTCTVYHKVLQGECPVGVIPIAPQDYDPARWWASSNGVKTTLSETLGWLHEWLWSSGR